MARNTQHDLLTTPCPEILARQRFILSLKRQTEQMRRRFVVHAEENHVSEASDSKEAFEDAVREIYAEDSYRAICMLKRAGQDMMWRSINDAIEDELPRLRAIQERTGAQDKAGSLHLADEGFRPPEGWDKARVHLQPGGYMRDADAGDVMAGALYEEGGALYSRGQGVGTRESKAECVIRFLTEFKPDFKPARILDIGCSAGASSVPYALKYPKAEVHAIDIGAGLLRYAHARAESIGAPVHFHQMNAEELDFADGSFDLVVSHNAMHEMSSDTQQAMFNESFRVLRKGGICIHQDLPLKFSELSAVRQADLMYDEWFNGELHWSDYAQMDCRTGLERAGFAPKAIQCEPFPLLDNTMSWLLAAAEKTEENAKS